MSIEIGQLLKTYGQQKAVNGVSFTVNKGEIVGFLGPNGAGKSTTMKMVTGYIHPDSGSVKVCGIPVASDPMAARRRIGYLPEANPLYYDMYVREYLDFIAGVHGIPSKVTRIEEVIGITGLALEAGKKVGQLSKGYKQRVGLAAALMHDPEVLILDEPTTGLDPNQIIEIREVIRQLGRDKTILFSSHILQEVEALCDRVIIINRGNIVADGRISDLKNGLSGHQVRVKFQGEPGEDWAGGLPAAKGIHREGGGDWLLDTDDPDALRKQVMECALQRNLNVVSLQSESRNLEEIFRTLTSRPE
jgi:ABC-2 type transport system ATP-binding protein